MSEETYESCLTGEYNMDKEAVEFIIQIYKLGGEEAIKQAKQLWDAMPKEVLTVVGVLASWGLADKIKELLKPVWGSLLEIIVAMILGLGVAAILLALTAAVECLPKLAD
jgi:hypothetical protein